MMRKVCMLFIFVFLITIQSAAYALNVTSPFGWRVHPISGEWQFHTGIDIAENLGCPISALYDGKVAFVGAYGGYGNTVILRHENETVTLYAHCDRIYARPGQRVMARETIATVGTTGNSTGPHLHLELWMDGQYVDPMVLFPDN
jgi:murein DD-endopeptidase MepM/ murein hydrolase activator NlpD